MVALRARSLRRPESLTSLRLTFQPAYCSAQLGVGRAGSRLEQELVLKIKSLQLVTLSLTSLVVHAGTAQAQCTVELNEVNYDCALQAGVDGDSCEFIELQFANFASDTRVHQCGVTQITYINGSNCRDYGGTLDLSAADMLIPSNGLFVLAREAGADVDYVPAAWTSMQNGEPDWLVLGDGTSGGARYYLYDFAPGRDDCSGGAGFVDIGVDYDRNTATDGGLPIREESVQLCENVWIGDVNGQEGNLLSAGPVPTPGAVNDCSTVIVYGYEDAGASAPDASLPDTSTPDQAREDSYGEDVAVLPDASRPDSARPDTTQPDATRPDSSGSGCGTVTLFGECNGSVLRYCDEDNDRVETYDCDLDDLLCGLVDCDDVTSCWGYDCVADIGETCGLSDQDNFCNGGLDQGCLDGVCGASAACQTDEVGSCQSNLLNWCYSPSEGPYGDIWSYDCTEDGSLPYVCGLTSVGVMDCLGVLGGMCDLAEGYECAPGLVCAGNGYCAEDPDYDAGPPVDGARADAVGADTSVNLDAGSRPDSVSAPDTQRADTRVNDLGFTLPDRASPDSGSTNVDDGGCGCAGLYGQPSVLLLLLAVGIAGIRRRREM